MKNHGPAFDNILLHQKVDLDCYVDLLFVLAFVLTGLATWHVCIGGELEKHTTFLVLVTLLHFLAFCETIPISQDFNAIGVSVSHWWSKWCFRIYYCLYELQKCQLFWVLI